MPSFAVVTAHDSEPAVYEAGVPNQSLLRIISDNVRDPAATIGDSNKPKVG